MLASTWMDPVLGVDIHIVAVPSPAGPVPTPLPHPFIGMVFDPMGLVVGAAMSSALGSGPTITMVNSMPATNCGTAVMAMPPHIPMPPGVAHPKPPDNDAELMFGGMQGGVEGSFGVRLGDIALSCGDPVRMPTSTVLAVPKGAPVMNMKPMAPDLMTIAMSGVMKAGMAGLGAAGRGLRAMQRSSKAWKRASSSIKSKLDGVTPQRMRGLRDRAVCFVTGHPVDVATGRMFTELTDLELPGPLPLKFGRAYDTSFSWRDGTLGPGWSHTFESSLWLEPGKVVLKAEDGRELEFSTLDFKDEVMRDGQSLFDPAYRMTLKCTGPMRFEVKESSGVVHKYEPVPGGDANVAQRVQKRDRTGFHLIEYHYDEQGRVEWVRDCGGRLVGLEYDKNGRLSALKVPLAKGHGHRVHRRFFYGRGGDLERVEDSLGHSWTFDYVEHLMVQETDRTGLSFYFQYDRFGAGAKCIRTWGDGGIYDHVITYTPDNKKTIVEDSLGAVTIYEMDDAMQVVSVMDAMGGTTKYEYDDATGLTSRTEDALGRITLQIRDERGNVVSVVRPDGSKLAWEYDLRFDLPTRFTNAAGIEWHGAYDDAGRLRSVHGPEGQSLAYEWAGGVLASLRDDRGRTVVLTHDERGQLTSSTDPSGAVEQYSYDGVGRLTKSRNAMGVAHRVTYDAEGRATSLERPLAVRQTREYDAQGNVVAVTEGRRAVRLGYSGFHRLAWREEDGARVDFGRDTEGRLAAVRNELGEVHQLNRDPAGRIVGETGFDGLTTTQRLDAAGQVTQVIGPEGAATDHEYDLLGRLIRVGYPDGTSAKLSYREDGALLRAENDATVVEFERDSLGRVLQETQDGGATWVRSEYSSSLGRVRVQSSLGANQEVGLGLRGEVLALSMQVDGAAHAVEFERDLLGRELGRAQSGRVQTVWKRDELGRPVERLLKREAAGTTSSPGDTIGQISLARYQWSGRLDLESIVDGAGRGRWFDRDERGRLTGERRGKAGSDPSKGLQLQTETIPRSLDAVGNVFRSTNHQDRRYGPGGRLIQSNGTDYHYGPGGERTQALRGTGDRKDYSYDGAGRLSELRTEDGREVRFAYDALGRRIRKSSFKRVGDDAVLESSVRYVWDGRHVLHEESGLDRAEATELTTWFWEPHSWAPISKVQGDRHYGIHSDHLGTPTEMTDELGELVWKMQLDAFGVAQFEEGTAEDCPWRWPGQYEDSETGLYYNNQRYYDPDTGQYIRKDPIGLLGGLRPYGYVEDVNTWADPWGLNGCETPDGDFVRVFHGSLDDSSKIRAEGLDQGRGTAYVSRDIAASEDAISPMRQMTQGANDPGIVEARIPKEDFDAIMAPHERPYGGFHPYPLTDSAGNPTSTEIPLRTPEARQLFNDNIVR